MDDETRNTIEKLDVYLEKKGMNQNQKISFLETLKLIYINSFLKDISLEESMDNLEAVDEGEDDLEDYEDELEEELEDVMNGEPELDSDIPQQTSKMIPSPIQHQQLKKPLVVKRPVMKLKQEEIDKGNF